MRDNIIRSVWVATLGFVFTANSGSWVTVWSSLKQHDRICHGEDPRMSIDHKFNQILLIPSLISSTVIGQTGVIQDRLHRPQSHSSLLYRVQMIFESSGHAGDQVNVVVHTAAHTAVHQRTNGWLLGTRIKEILCFVVAVHRAPGESILRGQRCL